MTGPSSSPSVGRKIVRPVFGSPREIGQLIELGPRYFGFQRRQLEQLDALFLRRRLQRVRPGPGLLRRAENARDLVAARQEGLEHGLAEILLTDDGDFHQAAFFGGRLKAPALFSDAILSFW
jgi:hypothetical protein